MQSEKKTLCTIAIVGCGTVGGGTAKLLLDSREATRMRTGLNLVLKYIVDKNFDHARKLNIAESLFCTDLDKVLADPEVNIIVELVGGTGFAKDLFSKALKAGKHVVTANKALLAQHGPELFGLARENGTSIGFEASCAGGIPLIRALYDGLMANQIQALFGIVNGTCNYILTEMIQKGTSYADALKGAQDAGYAEADPTLDVGGGDSAHKITILAGLAFGAAVELKDVSVSGINTLKSQDVAAGSSMGYVIKLIAQAQQTDSGVFVRVEPAFIARTHPLAWVSGSFNAVSVYGSAVGHTLYYGRGAGALPTASAVVADIIGIANGTYPLLFSQLAIWPGQTKRPALVPEDKIVRRYYMRFQVQDQPGVLAKITAILGKLGVSVASIHQPEAGEGENSPGTVPIVIIVHPTAEGTARKAVAEICAIPGIEKEAAIIPILDEHPEFRD